MKTNDYPWANVFIEIALRAIRRIHYEYGIWGIGRQWEMDRSRTALINMGQGIELADERTICAAITQEFMNSPAVSGLWNEGLKTEDRYFGIDREQPYEHDPNKKVDLCIIKYLKGNNNKITNPGKPPCFIEAKRARLWDIDLINGVATPKGKQTDKINSDVDRLQCEMNHRGENKIHCHLLIWGVYEKGENYSDDPEVFLKDIKNTKKHQLRWLPLKWELSQVKDPEIKVQKALWIALAEVGILQEAR